MLRADQFNRNAGLVAMTALLLIAPAALAKDHHSGSQDGGGKSSEKSSDSSKNEQKEKDYAAPSKSKSKPVRDARPSRDTDDGKTTAKAPKPAPDSGNNKQITTTPIGPGRNGPSPSATTTSVGPGRPGGTDTVKASTGGPPALAPPADAAAADETPGKKRSTATDGAPAPAPTPAPKSTAAVTAGPTALASAAIFRHNNSTMKFIPDGDVIRVVYDRPRDGLEPLGIKPGTPLFEGKKTGPNTYAGEATTFSRACGTAKFSVAGQSDGSVVTLRGEKPKRNGDCKVTGYASETLVFEAK